MDLDVEPAKLEKRLELEYGTIDKEIEAETSKTEAEIEQRERGIKSQLSAMGDEFEAWERKFNKEMAELEKSLQDRFGPEEADPDHMLKELDEIHLSDKLKSKNWDKFMLLYGKVGNYILGIAGVVSGALAVGRVVDGDIGGGSFAGVFSAASAISLYIHNRAYQELIKKEKSK